MDLTPFEICLKASDFSDADSTACNTLQTQFTIGTPSQLDAFQNTLVGTTHSLFTSTNINKIPEQLSLTRAIIESAATATQ